MTIAPEIRAIADAILYEGYILYPYRKSSLKNRQRWTFGGLFPKAYAERGGGDSSSLQCECLVRGDEQTRIGADVRFLQVAIRKIAKLSTPVKNFDEGQRASFEMVDGLDVDGRRYLPWEEAIERDCEIPAQRLAELARNPLEHDFAFDASAAQEPIRNAAGLIEGLILRESEAISSRISLSAERAAPGLFKLRLTVQNLTAIDSVRCASREMAVPLALMSTHAILTTQDGEFLSLTDPPQFAGDIARGCINDGCWPVLAGEEGDTDTGTVLASPIILYDYPRIAPESRSDLFDGTEIDEILILRTLTMTDAEKREMAAGDPRARDLLTRLESLTPDELGKLHGAWRSVTPAARRGVTPALVNLRTRNGELSVGERVRLKPRSGGDIMDIALNGKIAVVEAIERDFEDRVHVAVVVEEDPGREFGMARMPGHRFFFAPEEIERVAESAA